MITADDLQGHWRRDWITAPGFEDRTTRVHWMQAGQLFADVRVPLDRPDMGDYACLADLPPPALGALLKAERFAGTIDVANDRCTWRRDINWHGVPDADDIGLMSFEAGALLEDGVLADYRERWLPEPGERARGHRIHNGNLTGVLIESDTVFLLGIGAAPEQHPDLGGGDAIALRTHFQSVYCLGRWDGDDGIGTLCTNPFCEGQIVVSRTDGFVWHALSFDGARDIRPLKVH